MYVPQHRINRVGNPMQLFEFMCTFASRRNRIEEREYFTSVCEDMGLEASQVCQNWTELSGGQSQRAGLAVSIAARPSFLLLDEPTSSCDERSTRLVEKTLTSCISSRIWVSHNTDQVHRVPGRQFRLV